MRGTVQCSTNTLRKCRLHSCNSILYKCSHCHVCSKCRTSFFQFVEIYVLIFLIYWINCEYIWFHPPCTTCTVVLNWNLSQSLLSFNTFGCHIHFLLAVLPLPSEPEVRLRLVCVTIGCPLVYVVSLPLCCVCHHGFHGFGTHIVM